MNGLRAFLVLGVAVSFAACFSGGDNDDDGEASGFGKACSTDADCEADSLQCDTARGCVECKLNSDCAATETCSAGRCEGQGACQEDRDCASGQVCAAAVGVCVECLSSGDCAGGQICVDLACTESTACADTNECPGGQVCDTAASSCVECVSAGDCDSGEVCTDQSCVPSGGGGSGGTGGTGATGGTGGSGGSVSGGSGGTGGTGGGGNCTCDGGLVCDANDNCVDPDVLDDFADCDDYITEVASRSGQWYADADTGTNLTFAVSTPGSAWDDQSCGAWATGGPTGVGTQTWAVMGFEIASGSAYDLSDYIGVTITLESDTDVLVILKTLGGGYFGAWASGTAGSEARTVYFEDMFAMDNSALSAPPALTDATEFQFSPEDPAAFGYAIHNVTLL